MPGWRFLVIRGCVARSGRFRSGSGQTLGHILRDDIQRAFEQEAVRFELSHQESNSLHGKMDYKMRFVCTKYLWKQFRP